MTSLKFFNNKANDVSGLNHKNCIGCFRVGGIYLIIFNYFTKLS